MRSSAASAPPFPSNSSLTLLCVVQPVSAGVLSAALSPACNLRGSRITSVSPNASEPAPCLCVRPPSHRKRACPLPWSLVGQTAGTKHWTNARTLPSILDLIGHASVPLVVADTCAVNFLRLNCCENQIKPMHLRNRTAIHFACCTEIKCFNFLILKGSRLFK